LLAASLTAGCGRAPEPAGTGAAAAVRGYYEALLRKEWTRAYALLHSESRAPRSAEEFARQAANHRRGLGFEPDAVRVRACEERGDEAVAHVVFTGRAGGRQRSFRDAVTLRKSGATWGVVLSPRFGQSR
jgi:hypothetical protein